MTEKWPSRHDPVPTPTSTPVKYYPGLGYAPVKKAKHRPVKGERKNYNV